MGNFQVRYTLTITLKDEAPLSFVKERVLWDIDSSKPEQIQQCLEQELRETPTSGVLSELNVPSQKEISHYSIVVTNITELKATGDDDQM